MTKGPNATPDAGNVGSQDDPSCLKTLPACGTARLRVSLHRTPALVPLLKNVAPVSVRRYWTAALRGITLTWAAGGQQAPA